MKPGDLRSFVEARRTELACLVLAAATFAVYWQVSSFEFTNFDEFQMILNNPYVLGGVTLQGVWWALTTSWFDYWHPLPWISHMVDCELFGLGSGWHHLVNLAFHVANTLLLFAVLRRMTGAFWRSAMVAALFALHPLHVESVAWVAERKDTLSTLFFLLTLWAYARYAELQGLKSESRNTQHATRTTPPAPRPAPRAPLFYLLALAMFVLGLMSKPMVLTLPFVLLLLDYWPLRRLSFPALHLSPTPLLRLGLEKLPFFALTIASVVISYSGVKAGGSILSADAVPWGLRLGNVPISYARYLGKMIWPTDLIALYPMPVHLPWWQVGGAVLLLVLITLFALRQARSAPYLIVGWLFFLGILVPIIGIVQAGSQAIADRYTYIPSIGLFIAVVWASSSLFNVRASKLEVQGLKLDAPPSPVPVSTLDVGCSPSSPPPAHPSPVQGSRFTADAPSSLVPGSNLDVGCSMLDVGCSRSSPPSSAARLPWLPALVSVSVLLLCGYLTWVQAGYWRNSFTLWSHCLAICPDNFVAHYNLGYALQHSGKTSEAIDHYRAVLSLKPDHPDANLNLGIALIGSGKPLEATNYLGAALRAKPGYARVEGAMGLALLELHDYAGAVSHCGEAIRLDPGTFGPYVDMGRSLSAQGRSDDAVRNYAEGLRLSPAVPQTHYYLGLEWMKRGAFEQAAASFGEAVRLAPTWAEARTQQQLALTRSQSPAGAAR